MVLRLILSQDIAIKIKDLTSIPVGVMEGFTLKVKELEIKKGEFVGILGDHNSGKQALLMTLNGIIPNEIPCNFKGEVIVDGLRTIDTPLNVLAAHVGLVFRNPVTQIIHVTVEEEAAFGPCCLGLPRGEIRKRVNEALEICRLKGFEKRNPLLLSGGEQQSLAIASIIAMRPNIIAMDEPIAMLDPLGGARVYSIIDSLRKNYNLTILISESGCNVETLVEHVDRLLYMEDGEIKLDGSPSEVLSNEMLKRVGIPQVTELFLELKKIEPDIPIPVTLDQAYRYLSSRLKGKEQLISVKTYNRRKESKTNPNDTIVKVRNLWHVYSGATPVQALKGINIDIYKQTLTAIIGQNGSGKTTLAKHLVGLLKPTNGDAEIIVDGIDIKKAGLAEITEHINYVYQRPEEMFFCNTTFDEVAWGLRQRGLSEEEVKKKVSEILSYFGIEKYAQEYIVNLPRYVRTLLAISMIVVLEPNVIIIDEPTGGLDHEQGQRLMHLLRKLVEEKGKTIVIITHDMKLVAEFADYTIVMAEGNVLLTGPTREVFSKPDVLQRAWINPPQITQLAQKLSQFGIPPDIMTVNEMLEVLTNILSLGGEK
jgi:energy-coupling factor transport system ATP-binding protein